MDPFISILLDTLRQDQILFGDQLKERFNHIWKMNEGLNAKALLLPENTAEVSAIMKQCYQHNQEVIVFGGLTNLVGSTETKGSEIIISTERMNRIEEVDPKSRTMTVQSGVILENVQSAALKNDLLFPLNFGAKGSAQMGGIISTNAGGLRVFRYGMTRNLVLGLEAVLADGTIINSLKKIIKDNSAYDLKQLFVGSEGSLGVITRAVLKLVEKPSSRISAFVALDQYENVMGLLKLMDQGMAGTLSGFELIYGNTYQTMTTSPASVKPPVEHGFNYYVLIEGLGSDQQKDQERIQHLLEEAFDRKLIVEAAIAESSSDLEWFWQIREDVHVLVSQCDFDQHFDISLPIPLIDDYVAECKEQLSSIPEVSRVFTFGHVADGNMHFIIGKQHNQIYLTERINDIIYGRLKDVGGSVSAEHGIGLHKKAYLSLCRTNEEIEMMRLLKRSLDPKNILNKGKVIDL